MNMHHQKRGTYHMAITIKDVAARCGLSVSTVSKAFNHYCDISEHTREMVQRTAREMGYFPIAPIIWVYCLWMAVKPA